MAVCPSSFQGLPLSGGTLTGPLTVPTPSGGNLPLVVQQTPAAGYTKVNGTGNIWTYAVPNDGRPHAFLLVGQTEVTLAETGGQLQIAYTAPNGVGATTGNPDAGGSGAGANSWSQLSRFAAPGTTITLSQSTALTVGASVVNCQLWLN